MELDRYYELRTLLQRWLRRLADNIRNRIEANNTSLQRLETLYDQEGVGEEFTLWLDRWCRQAAIQFILRILFLRVLEDRNLLGTIRLRSSDGQQMWQQLTRNLGAAHYVQWCSWDAAHLLPDLFGPTDYDLVLPGDELAQQFLDDVWRRPDANRADWLRYDFRSDPTQRDGGFQTRFIGDLYQELDAEIRERYALLQTPHFISQFILEHTLLKRFQEKDFREVTLIDPTCGSAHFLVDAFWLFVAEYERMLGKSRNQLSSHKRAEIARTIIEKHLHGCDINPYATALARFRLVLAACDYAQPVSLYDFRDLHFNIATIDSLIPYETLMRDGVWGAESTKHIFGQLKEVNAALPILRRTYDVIVGNPPYITPNDPEKRSFYNEVFTIHYVKGIHLSLLFMIRVFQMAKPSAYIGLIVDNAFAIKRFGEKWVTQFLPQKHLSSVYDLSGLSIEGHGTATLLLFMRNHHQTNAKVNLVYCTRGDRNISNTSSSPLWKEIVSSSNLSPHVGEYVESHLVPVKKYHKHPWPLDVKLDQLYDQIKSVADHELNDILVQRIGAMMVTRCDSAYLLHEHVLRRAGIAPNYVRQLAKGELVRDWECLQDEMLLFPYDADLQPLDQSHVNSVAVTQLLGQVRSILERRKAFGKTQVETGRYWYEFNMLMSRQFERHYLIAYPAVTTSHNHFCLLPAQVVAHHSLQVFTLKESFDHIKETLVAILNSALGCFCMKREGAPKRQEDDPVKSYYDFDGTSMGRFPLVRQIFLENSLTKGLFTNACEIIFHAQKLTEMHLSKVFAKEGETYLPYYQKLGGYVAPYSDLATGFANATELIQLRDWAIELRKDIRQRIIFLQEEIDWLVYEIYSLVNHAPLSEKYLAPKEYKQARLQLGQRAFELAGKGYQRDWPTDYKPDPLSNYLRPLTEARIAIINTNPDIALLEDPLYKRRWAPPDYDKEFREAAEWWLAEKLEYALEHYKRPITLRQWAQLLRNDERVNATLEVLTGSPMFDLEEELRKVIDANAVPNRPEHYLKATGLRKLTVEEAEFKSGDFSDNTAWRLRGKLNIPRERFIAYREFDHSRRGVDAPDSGGPWYGWAGWDVVQRAEALAHLLDQANRAGWEVNYRQCGLRAALRDLLPALHTALSADEVLEFRGIAELCGMGIETRCYCRAYREGVAALDQLYPGAPGVTAEAVSNLAAPATQKKRKVNSKARSQPATEQWALDLIDNPDEQAENEE